MYWDPALCGEGSHVSQHRGSNALVLVLRVHYELTNMHVQVATLHDDVTAAAAFPLKDFDGRAVPLAIERCVLEGLVPRSELSLDNLTKGSVVGTSRKLDVVGSRRATGDVQVLNAT